MPNNTRDGQGLIGPYGPSPDMNPELFDPMNCDRCHQPITLADEWFMEVPVGPSGWGDDGSVYHGGCLVG